MLNPGLQAILDQSRDIGWVLEPDAKKLLALGGIAVPRFEVAIDREQAIQFAQKIGYPVVAKVVSPQILHKSDAGGVVVGVHDAGQLADIVSRFEAMEGYRGVLLEEMLPGIELIVGGKIDYQFGPVVLLGIGGTGVEIYQDTSLGMAPITESDVASMVDRLKGGRLIKGYRGSEPVNFSELARLMLSFSAMMIELETQIDSIDLNR